MPPTSPVLGVSNNPLFLACINGDVALTSSLLSGSSLEVNEWTATGASALHHACIGGSAECVALLLANGADHDHADHEGLTPLHCACVRGHAACCAALLDRSAIDTRDANGVSALHMACFKGHARCVELLLASQRMPGYVDDPDCNGVNALSYAAMGGHATCLQALLARGAALPAGVVPNDGDNGGETAPLTALAYAHRGGHRECVNLLVAAEVGRSRADEAVRRRDQRRSPSPLPPSPPAVATAEEKVEVRPPRKLCPCMP